MTETQAKSGASGAPTDADRLGAPRRDPDRWCGRAHRCGPRRRSGPRVAVRLEPARVADQPDPVGRVSSIQAVRRTRPTSASASPSRRRPRWSKSNPPVVQAGTYTPRRSDLEPRGRAGAGADLVAGPNRWRSRYARATPTPDRQSDDCRGDASTTDGARPRLSSGGGRTAATRAVRGPGPTSAGRHHDRVADAASLDQPAPATGRVTSRAAGRRRRPPRSTGTGLRQTTGATSVVGARPAGRAPPSAPPGSRTRCARPGPPWPAPPPAARAGPACT